MSTGPDRSAGLKFVVTNTLIVRDILRSVAFYRDVLGATVLREGEPGFLRLGNIWLTINGGGGMTAPPIPRMRSYMTAACAFTLA